MAAVFRRGIDRQSLRRAFDNADQPNSGEIDLVLVSVDGSELANGSVAAEVVVLDNYAAKAKEVYAAVRRLSPTSRVIVVTDTPDALFSLTIPRHLVALREASEPANELLLRIVTRSPLRPPTFAKRVGSESRALSSTRDLPDAESQRRVFARAGRTPLRAKNETPLTRGGSAASPRPVTTRPVQMQQGSAEVSTAGRQRPEKVVRTHVLIGASTGGPKALKAVLKGLPESFPLPILIVQHMPAGFTGPLADRLNHAVALHVREAEPGVMPRAGEVWIAPGDEHLVIANVTGQLGLSHAPKVNGCRPAVDVLFESAARAFGKRIVAVVLTGMGQDGTQGCKQIAAAGGHLIVQDQATSSVWGMPGSIVKNNLNPEVAPLEQIALKIRAQTQRGQRALSRSNNARGTQ